MRAVGIRVGDKGGHLHSHWGPATEAHVAGHPDHVGLPSLSMNPPHCLTAVLGVRLSSARDIMQRNKVTDGKRIKSKVIGDSHRSQTAASMFVLAFAVVVQARQ
jgi:hypothetical protein